MTQEYLVYFKENRQSTAEKDPPLGCVDIFQTSPNKKLKKFFIAALHAAPPSADRKSIDNILGGICRQAAECGLKKRLGCFIEN